MSDRVVLVEAELNLTTAMLELPAAPSFAEVCRQPLEFFTQARKDVQGCVSAFPPSPAPAQRPRCGAAPYPAVLPAGGSVAPALGQAEALAAQAAGGHANSKSGQRGGGVWGVGALTGGCARPAELTQRISPPQDSAESAACLRAATIPYVMQVLDNLRCAALQDKC